MFLFRLFVGGSLICRCRRKNHVYTHTNSQQTNGIRREKMRRRSRTMAERLSAKNKKKKIKDEKTERVQFQVKRDPSPHAAVCVHGCVRHGINRDQNFYCFFLCTRWRWCVVCVCVCIWVYVYMCHLFAQETFNVFIRIPFVFPARGVLRMSMAKHILHIFTHINT